VDVLAVTLLLPVPEDLSLEPLHRLEDTHVKGLHEAGGVFRQEAEADVVLMKELQDVRRQVGS
jgi:hypothetical protein